MHLSFEKNAEILITGRSLCAAKPLFPACCGCWHSFQVRKVVILHCHAKKSSKVLVQKFWLLTQ